MLALFVLLIAPTPATWTQYGGPTRDFRVPDAPATTGGVVWKRAFGPGTSGVVTDGKRLYTQYAIPREAGKTFAEVTTALDPATGKPLWEESVEVAKLPKQETFGGAALQPLATPAVFDGKLFTLGFTGLLQARDAASGKQLWGVDLVAEMGATAVQFGFAASPIVIEGKLLMHVGGKHALIAFDPKDGQVQWRSAAAEPAYATPVPVTFGGRSIVIQQTRDTLLGVDLATGKTVLEYPLPKKGLTNVPTPIPLPEGKLLVSGQGWDGTRLLQMSAKDETLELKELWFQRRVQFFYTNWVVEGEAVYGFPGNAGKRLSAVSLKDGQVISQEVGHTDANVVFVGRRALLARGDGLLSLGTFSADGFDVQARAKPLTGRCWNPPTVVGDVLILRTDRELAMMKLSALTADFQAPADAGVSALDAAFGKKK